MFKTTIYETQEYALIRLDESLVGLQYMSTGQLALFPAAETQKVLDWLSNR